jgi:PII-like signaling protein
LNLSYTRIRIYTSEKARHAGKSVPQAVVHYLHGLRIGARCSVFRGEEGLYENGEISTDAVTDLSYNLPLLIDVFVPAEQGQAVLSVLRAMVPDALVSVDEAVFFKGQD